MAGQRKVWPCNEISLTKVEAQNKINFKYFNFYLEYFTHYD